MSKPRKLDRWRALPLGEVLAWLEKEKEDHWARSQSLPTGQARSGAWKQYEQAESAFSSLNRVMVYLASNQPPGSSQGPAEEGPEGKPAEEIRVSFHKDPCPVCDKPVPTSEDEVVWMCPSNRERKDPGWMPPVVQVTQELMKQRQIWSNCGNDYGLPCYPAVPLHPECHKQDFIIYAPNPANSRRGK